MLNMLTKCVGVFLLGSVLGCVRRIPLTVYSRPAAYCVMTMGRFYRAAMIECYTPQFMRAANERPCICPRRYTFLYGTNDEEQNGLELRARTRNLPEEQRYHFVLSNVPSDRDCTYDIPIRLQVRYEDGTFDLIRASTHRGIRKLRINPAETAEQMWVSDAEHCRERPQVRR